MIYYGKVNGDMQLFSVDLKNRHTDQITNKKGVSGEIVATKGHEVYYQSRPRGRETDDRLTWIKADRAVQHFWVNQIHAGPAHVTIRYTDHGDRVWVEASSKPWDQLDSQVVASIDLTTSEFREEFQQKPTWAALGIGQVLGAGQTWDFVHIIGPW